MSENRRLLSCAAVVFLCSSMLHASGNQHSLSSYDRGLSLSMLKQEKEDLQKNYYDRSFRGFDIDAIFA